MGPFIVTLKLLRQILEHLGESPPDLVGGLAESTLNFLVGHCLDHDLAAFNGEL